MQRIAWFLRAGLAGRVRFAALWPIRLARYWLGLPAMVLLGLAACNCAAALSPIRQPAPILEAEALPQAGAAPGRLAFVRGGDVWVKDVADGPELRLTTDGQHDEPRWSASGTWLAVRQRTSASGTPAEQVIVMHSDGSDRHTLGETSPGQDVWWSPSSDRLAFVEAGHALVVNADRTDRLDLPKATSVAWSPDGAWLAYAELNKLAPANASQPSQWHTTISRARRDGTNAQLVLDGGAPSPDSFVLASWSLDDARILFWTGPGGSFLADGAPLQAVPAAGGTPTTIVTKMLTYPDSFAWAPDGRRLAAVQGGRRSSWYRKDIVVTEPAAPLRDLASVGSVELFPAWSPDGQWLAFTTAPATDTDGGNSARAASSQRRIALMRADGTDRHLLTNTPGAQDERARWSRDGQTLIFGRVQQGQRAQLWQVRADGSDPHLVVDNLDVQALTGVPASVDPGWFGYSGHLRWDRAYDWWQPALKTVR